jgi:hypothetical protein
VSIQKKKKKIICGYFFNGIKSPRNSCASLLIPHQSSAGLNSLGFDLAESIGFGPPEEFGGGEFDAANGQVDQGGDDEGQE